MNEYWNSFDCEPEELVSSIDVLTEMDALACTAVDLTMMDFNYAYPFEDIDDGDISFNCVSDKGNILFPQKVQVHEPTDQDNLVATTVLRRSRSCGDLQLPPTVEFGREIRAMAVENPLCLSDARATAICQVQLKEEETRDGNFSEESPPSKMQLKLVKAKLPSNTTEQLKYTCPICLDVYRTPVSLACTHTFCRGCLIKAAPSLDSCPVCRAEQPLDPRKNKERALLGEYLKQQFKDDGDEEDACLFDMYLSAEERKKAILFRRHYQYWRRKFHYGARGEFGAVVKLDTVHMRQESFRPGEDIVEPVSVAPSDTFEPKKLHGISAINQDVDPECFGTDVFDDIDDQFSDERRVVCESCRCEMEAKEVDQHQKSECSERAIQCVNSCGVKIPASQMSAHVDAQFGSCGHAVIVCPFAFAGCNFSLVRKNLHDHLTDPMSMRLHIGMLNTLNYMRYYHQLAQSGQQIPVMLVPPVRREQPPLLQSRQQREKIASATNSTTSTAARKLVGKRASPSGVQDIDCPVWKGLKTYGMPPSGRYDHTAVMYEGRMIVLGGVTEFKRTNDLHVLDVNEEIPKWMKPNVTGTPPSEGVLHQAAVVEKTMYVIGGSSDGKTMNAFHSMNLDSPEYHWESPAIDGTPPSVRYWHSLSAVGSRLYVFGGYSGGVRLNDLYVIDVSTPVPIWSEVIVQGIVPSVRSSHTAVVLEENIIVFGGYDGRGRKNDVHILDVSNPTEQKWRELQVGGKPPSVRYNHSCVLLGKRMLLFGGNSGSLKNDVHVLELGSTSPFWSQPKTFGDAPSVRYWHSCVTHDHKMIVFGGYSGMRRENDLYCLDMMRFSQIEMVSSAPQCTKKRRK